MDDVVLVVRMNELTGRGTSARVPLTVDEIAADAAACVEAGAAAVHFHGRTRDGAGDPSAATLGATVEAVRAACDAVTYCTLGAGTQLDRHERLAMLTGAATRPEIAPVDLGTFNLDPYDVDAGRFLTEEGVYVNTVGTVRHLVEGITAAGVTPSAVCWSTGSLRLLGALCDQGTWPTPVFAELVVSDRLLVTNPASPLGVDQLLTHLPDVPCHWTAMCAGGSILPLVEHVVAAGGGLAFGLGDHPYPELGPAPTNAEVVAVVAAELRRLGRRPASPDQLRQRLAG
jgi:uncharacterized protein (DUF849 family)